MAITPQYTLTKAEGTSNSLTANLGTQGVNWEPGDFAIIVAASHSGTPPAYAVFNDHGTWDSLAQLVYTTANDGVIHTSRVYYRVLQDGDTAPTITASTGVVNLITGQIWRGVNQASPFGATPTSTASTSAGSALTAPTLTPSVSDCMSVRAWVVGNDFTVASYSEGSELYDLNTTSSSDVQTSMSYLQKSGTTAFGTATATASAGTAYWHAYTFALAPAIPDVPTGYSRITVADDYENLSTETKAWLSALDASLENIAAGDYIDYQVTDGTLGAVTNWLEFGWQSTSGEVTFNWWDGATYQDNSGSGFVQTFAVPSFSGLVRDTFTGTNGTSIASHTPDTDTEGGGWSIDRSAVNDPAPTAPTLQSNKFSATGTSGAVIDAGTGNVDLKVIWSVGASATAGQVHVRRADSSNFIAVNLSQANGWVRIQRRDAGVFALMAQASVAWEANTDYEIRVIAVQNSIDVYVNGSLTVSTTYTGLQGASNTFVGLFGGTFDTLEVEAETPALPQSLSTDKQTYAAGDSILCTISPEAIGVLPDTATLDGVAVTLGSPTTTSCTITVPDFADLLPGESHEAVRLGVPVTLEITMDDASTVEATVTITPDADVNEPNQPYFNGTVSDTQAGQGALENFAEGDGYLFVVEQGAITGINEAGEITYSGFYGGKMYRYPAA